MRLNTNARQTLIGVGGTIETGFTPGPFSMELSAVVYNSWRFNETSLPADLLKRSVLFTQSPSADFKAYGACASSGADAALQPNGG